VLKPIDTIKIDAQNMEFSKVELFKALQFNNNGKQLLLIFLSKGRKNNVSLIM
jgi:aminopeptidase N